MDNKLCGGPCGRVKPRTDFYADKAAADGLRYQCKDCQKAQSRASNAKLYGAEGLHRDKKKQWNKKAYEKIKAEHERAFLRGERPNTQLPLKRVKYEG